MRQIKEGQSKGYEQLSDENKLLKENLKDIEGRLISENQDLKDKLEDMKKEIITLIKNN